MTLACEDANSNLLDVVYIADVGNEDRVGNSLLQIWKLRVVHKAKLRFGQDLKLKFRRDFEAEVWTVFCC